MLALSDFPESSCACRVCQSMCERSPCWGTPQEIGGILALHGPDRLSVDVWEPGLLLIVPKMTPAGCTFLKDGRCTIHPYRPTEGRRTLHGMKHANRLRALVVDTWRTAAGRNVVARFDAASRKAVSNLLDILA